MFYTEEKLNVWSAFLAKVVNYIEERHISQAQYFEEKHMILNANKVYLISQKDVGREEHLLLKPFYFMPFLI